MSLVVFDVPQVEPSTNKTKRELEYETLEKQSRLASYHFTNWYEMESTDAFTFRSHRGESTMTSVMCKDVVQYCVPITAVDAPFSITLQNDVPIDTCSMITVDARDDSKRGGQGSGSGQGSEHGQADGEQGWHGQERFDERENPAAYLVSGGGKRRRRQHVTAAPVSIVKSCHVAAADEQIQVTGVTIPSVFARRRRWHSFFDFIRLPDLAITGRYGPTDFETEHFPQQHASQILGDEYYISSLTPPSGSAGSQPLPVAPAQSSSDVSWYRPYSLTQSGQPRAAWLGATRASKAPPDLPYDVIFTSEADAKTKLGKILRFIDWSEDTYGNSFTTFHRDLQLITTPLRKMLDERDYVPLFIASVIAEKKKLPPLSAVMQVLAPAVAGIITTRSAMGSRWILQANHLRYAYNIGRMRGVDDPAFRAEFERHLGNLRYKRQLAQQRRDSRFMRYLAIKRNFIARGKYKSEYLQLDQPKRAVVRRALRQLEVRLSPKAASPRAQKYSVLFSGLRRGMHSLEKIVLVRAVKAVEAAIGKKELDGKALLEGQCPHVYARAKLVQQHYGDDNLAQVLARGLVAPFGLPPDRSGHFCRICGEKLAEADNEGTVRFMGNERVTYTRVEDPLRTMIWKEATYIISSNVRFPVVISVRPLLSTIAGAVRQALEAKNVEVHRSRTINVADARDTMNLYASIYIYAAIAAIIAANPGDIVFGRSAPGGTKRGARGGASSGGRASSAGQAGLRDCAAGKCDPDAGNPNTVNSLSLAERSVNNTFDPDALDADESEARGNDVEEESFGVSALLADDDDSATGSPAADLLTAASALSNAAGSIDASLTAAEFGESQLIDANTIDEEFNAPSFTDDKPFTPVADAAPPSQQAQVDAILAADSDTIDPHAVPDVRAKNVTPEEFGEPNLSTRMVSPEYAAPTPVSSDQINSSEFGDPSVADGGGHGGSRYTGGSGGYATPYVSRKHAKHYTRGGASGKLSTNAKTDERRVLTDALNLLLISKDSIIHRLPAMSADAVKQIFLRDAYLKWARKYARPIKVAHTVIHNTAAKDIALSSYYVSLDVAARPRTSQQQGKQGRQQQGKRLTIPTLGVKRVLGRSLEKLDAGLRKGTSLYATVHIPKTSAIDVVPPSWDFGDHIYDLFRFRSFVKSQAYINDKMFDEGLGSKSAAVDAFTDAFADVDVLGKQIARRRASHAARPATVIPLVYDLSVYSDWRIANLGQYYCKSGALHRGNSYVYAPGSTTQSSPRPLRKKSERSGESVIAELSATIGTDRNNIPEGSVELTLAKIQDWVKHARDEIVAVVAAVSPDSSADEAPVLGLDNSALIDTETAANLAKIASSKIINERCGKCQLLIRSTFYTPAEEAALRKQFEQRGAEDALFRYFDARCPVGSLHKIEGESCVNCGKVVNTRDPAYYKKYIATFRAVQLAQLESSVANLAAVEASVIAYQTYVPPDHMMRGHLADVFSEERQKRGIHMTRSEAMVLESSMARNAVTRNAAAIELAKKGLTRNARGRRRRVDDGDGDGKSKSTYSLRNVAKWVQVSGAPYNVLSNIGLTDGEEFADIVAGRLDPKTTNVEPDIPIFSTQAMAVKGYVTMVLREYNMLRNYKNVPTLPPKLQSMLDKAQRDELPTDKLDKLMVKINNFSALDQLRMYSLSPRDYANFLLEYLAEILVGIGSGAAGPFGVGTPEKSAKSNAYDPIAPLRAALVKHFTDDIIRQEKNHGVPISLYLLFTKEESRFGTASSPPTIGPDGVPLTGELSDVAAEDMNEIDNDDTIAKFSDAYDVEDAGAIWDLD